ncbi:MAG: hypothetical protein AAB134_02260 [Pseudomonadota bacterium]
MPLIAVVLTIVALCSSCGALDQAAKANDRETYELLSPYTLRGIEADTALDPGTRRALLLKVSTWEVRTR